MQTYPHRGVRALPEAHGEHAGWRWLAAGSLDHPVRQQHEQQRHAQQRSAAVGGVRPWLRQDQGRPAPALSAGHAASRTCCSRCSIAPGFRSRSSATAPASSPRSEDEEGCNDTRRGCGCPVHARAWCCDCRGRRARRHPVRCRGVAAAAGGSELIAGGADARAKDETAPRRCTGPRTTPTRSCRTTDPRWRRRQCRQRLRLHADGGSGHRRQRRSADAVAEGRRRCRIHEPGRADRADGGGAHRQCRGGEAAAEARRQGRMRRSSGAARRADVGCRAEPAGDDAAAGQARRRRRMPAAPCATGSGVSPPRPARRT